MSEMVERVAIAIWEARPTKFRLRWDECIEEFREQKRIEARAVIAAMREPTEGMIKAGNKLTDWAMGADDAWEAMIDEALK